ncbi:unnamed protein product [Ectocarpus sp. 13 AM-2016]
MEKQHNLSAVSSAGSPLGQHAHFLTVSVNKNDNVRIIHGLGALLPKTRNAPKRKDDPGIYGLLATAVDVQTARQHNVIEHPNRSIYPSLDPSSQLHITQAAHLRPPPITIRGQQQSPGTCVLLIPSSLSSLPRRTPVYFNTHQLDSSGKLTVLSLKTDGP